MNKASIVKLALKKRKTGGPVMSGNPFPGSTDEPKAGVVRKGTGSKADMNPVNRPNKGAVFWAKAKKRGA